jgi:flagellar FliJ protein
MYKFNLQPLLNHRRYQEEILQKEFAESKEFLTEEQKKLRIIKQKKREYSQELQQRQRNDGTVSELILYFRYLDRLSKDLDNQKHRVAIAEKQFNKKRKDLIGIMKKRKTLEKLKEKGWKGFQHRVLKKERDFMDEIAAKQVN